VSVEHIEKLALLMAKKGILELEIKDADFEYCLKRNKLSPPISLTKKKEDVWEIKAQTVGIFYPKARPKERIKSNQVVGLITVIGESFDLVSDRDGEILEVLVEEGQAVQYGQPLFLCKYECEASNG
jgi:biotin carboxyl carrier protein